MTTPPNDPGRDLPRSDERTRDIRLPSQPDRPPAAVRPEWQAHVAQRTAEAPVEMPGNGATPETAALPSRSREQVPPRPYVLPDDPTDKLAPPSVAPPSPARPAAGAPSGAGPSGPPAVPPVQGPAEDDAPGHAAERNRRWPWVVVTVLPILVIVGAGLMLLLLLRGG